MKGMKRTVEEQWAQIEEFGDYSISDKGRVKYEPTGYIKTASVNRQGIEHVLFSVGGSQSRREVIRLVAEAFLPPPSPSHFDTPINLNGNRSDNRVNNLMWRPRWFAVKYNYQMLTLGRLPDFPDVIDLDTGEVTTDLYSLITREGLLASDLYEAIDCNTYVFPTNHRYGWYD